jgi:hypothetical protein
MFLNDKYSKIIIIEDFTPTGGGGRPIYNYYRHKQAKGENILFFRLNYRFNFLRVIVIFLFYKRQIIINGITAFKFWSVLFFSLFKKNILIYLHEAEPHVEPFRKQHPFKFYLLKIILGKRKVAFCSEWQKEYFKQFSPLSFSKVVYNTFALPVKLEKSNLTTVCMVGYQTINKNVSFFSELADFSKQQKDSFQFVWIGGDGGDGDKVYKSDHVLWLGDHDNIYDILNNVDILLFTSKADCFPLSVLEAIAKHKRIIAYKENGIAPFLKNLRGSYVFDEFDIKSIYCSLNKILLKEVDVEAYDSLIYDLCSFQQFEKRMESI